MPKLAKGVEESLKKYIIQRLMVIVVLTFLPRPAPNIEEFFWVVFSKIADLHFLLDLFDIK